MYMYIYIYGYAYIQISHRQGDLNVLLLGGRHDLGHDLGSLLVVERGADGHVVDDLNRKTYPWHMCIYEYIYI